LVRAQVQKILGKRDAPPSLGRETREKKLPTSLSIAIPEKEAYNESRNTQIRKSITGGAKAQTLEVKGGTLMANQKETKNTQPRFVDETRGHYGPDHGKSLCSDVLQGFSENGNAMIRNRSRFRWGGQGRTAAPARLNEKSSGATKDISASSCKQINCVE